VGSIDGGDEVVLLSLWPRANLAGFRGDALLQHKQQLFPCTLRVQYSGCWVSSGRLEKLDVWLGESAMRRSVTLLAVCPLGWYDGGRSVVELRVRRKNRSRETLRRPVPVFFPDVRLREALALTMRALLFVVAGLVVT